MKTQRPNQQHAARGTEPEQKRLQVRDVMSTNVIFTEPSESVLEVAKKLSQLDVGSLPVCDGGQLVGMITDRDIVVRVLAEERSMDAAVGDAMTSHVVWAYDDDEIGVIVESMQDAGVRRIPVVNRKKQLVGIVSLADVARSDASASLKAKGVAGVS